MTGIHSGAADSEKTTVHTFGNETSFGPHTHTHTLVVVVTVSHPESEFLVFCPTEPRVNKPPAAKVSPKFQEISLPTSSTVIDGSRESHTHLDTHTHTIKASWDMWLFHHMMFIVWKIISLLFLFSESTDDDKVVAWHWEEVKGPLREEKVSADTPVLTLTGLVPGNYTFKYCPVPLRLMLQPQTVYKKWTLK